VASRALLTSMASGRVSANLRSILALDIHARCALASLTRHETGLLSDMSYVAWLRLRLLHAPWDTLLLSLPHPPHARGFVVVRDMSRDMR
jgi:hypothetical protein